jgi:hypothetical protein
LVLKLAFGVWIKVFNLNNNLGKLGFWFKDSMTSKLHATPIQYKEMTLKGRKN